MTAARFTLAVLVAAALLVAGPLRAEEEPPAEAPRLSYAAFLEQRAAGRLVVVDTRATSVFERGHIPGALSIPFGQEERHVERLRALGKRIAVYCA